MNITFQRADVQTYNQEKNGEKRTGEEKKNTVVQ